jgi:hypothetical protein
MYQNNQNQDQVLFTSPGVQVGNINFTVQVVRWGGNGEPKMRAVSASNIGAKQCNRFTSSQFEACIPLFQQASEWIKVNMPQQAKPAADVQSMQAEIAKLQAQLSAMTTKVA